MKIQLVPNKWVTEKNSLEKLPVFVLEQLKEPERTPGSGVPEICVLMPDGDPTRATNACITWKR